MMRHNHEYSDPNLGMVVLCRECATDVDLTDDDARLVASGLRLRTDDPCDYCWSRPRPRRRGRVAAASRRLATE